MACWLRLNGDTGNNYDYVQQGRLSSGSSADAHGEGQGHILLGNVTDLGLGGRIHIDDYTTATTRKLVTYETTRLRNASGLILGLQGHGIWRSNDAITSIGIRAIDGTGWDVGSRFVLIGSPL